jgi:hypothetical protein
MDRLQLALECLEIEKAGGSVREYLASKGCISPWGTWHRLQKEELGRNEYQITDGKGGDDMKKIALADKKKAVEIAIGGGDPLEYLRKCGSKNPQALWYMIKKNLQEVEPDQYAKLLCAVKHGEEEHQCPDYEPKEAAENEEPKPLDGGEWEAWPAQEQKDKKPEEKMTVLSEDLKKAIEEPWRAAEFQRHTAVVLEDDFRIYGLNTRAGDFQTEAGFLCWTPGDGEQVNLPVGTWKMLLEVVPKVLSVMGL